MSDAHDHEHDDDHDHDHEHECGHDHDHDELADLMGLELDTQTQIFIEMRGQNLELLKIAAQVAGFAGPHSPLKPNDLRSALKSIWDVYSEFYQWVDPEDIEDDDEDEDE